MLQRPILPRLPALILAAGLVAASTASAECYADYKAKRDNPLKLHYGVIAVPDDACDAQSAEAEIAGRIASDGWILLKVLGVFGPEGLDQRRDSAGEYFLRF